MSNTVYGIDATGVVLVATIGTSNQATLTGLGQTVGGVACSVAGTLVGLVGQSTAAQNGLWRVQSGAWDYLVPGQGLNWAAFGLFCVAGTNQGTWSLTTSPNGIVPLTTSLAFAQTSGGGSEGIVSLAFGGLGADVSGSTAHTATIVTTNKPAATGTAVAFADDTGAALSTTDTIRAFKNHGTVMASIQQDGSFIGPKAGPDATHLNSFPSTNGHTYATTDQIPDLTAPGPIGGGTPNAGAFTGLTASTSPASATDVLRAQDQGCFYGGGSNLAADTFGAATKYVSGFGQTTVSATPVVLGIATKTGKLRRLYLNLNVAPGGSDTVVATVQISTDNGATWTDTSLTCTATGSAKSASNTATAATVVLGYLIGVKLVSSATTAAGPTVGCELCIA